MDVASLSGRIRSRYLEDEALPREERIAEALITVRDRLAIRLGVDDVPSEAESIVVDASVKVLRLGGYEGSTSESASDGGSVSNTFVESVLAEYEPEIGRLYEKLHRAGVKFL